MLDTPTPCTPQGPAYLHQLLNTAERKTDITTTFFLLLSVHSPNSFSAFMKSTWDNMGKVSKYLHCFQACKFPLSYWLPSFKRPIVRSKLMKAPCSKNSDKLCDVAAAVCVGNGGADAPPNKWLKLILSVFVTVVPSPIVKSWIILQFSPVVSPLLSSFVTIAEWIFEEWKAFWKVHKCWIFGDFRVRNTFYIAFKNKQFEWNM